MLLDKLAEEGKGGEVEFVADFLDRLVAVAQLLADSAHSGLVYQVKGRTARLVFHALGEILRGDVQHIGKDRHTVHTTVRLCQQRYKAAINEGALTDGRIFLARHAG